MRVCVDAWMRGCVDGLIYITGEQVPINVHEKEIVLAISSQ